VLHAQLEVGKPELVLIAPVTTAAAAAAAVGAVVATAVLAVELPDAGMIQHWIGRRTDAPAVHMIANYSEQHCAVRQLAR